jgi:hypothetical protein
LTSFRSMRASALTIRPVSIANQMRPNAGIASPGRP